MKTKSATDKRGHQQAELDEFRQACLAVVEDVLALVPAHCRDGVRDLELQRPRMNRKQREQARKTLVSSGANDEEQRVIKAGLNAVAYATWAISRLVGKDSLHFSDFIPYGEACRLLGGIQGHLGAVPDFAALEKQRLNRVAKNAIAAKLARDPTQIAKAEARRIYFAWQEGTGEKFASNADFARKMVARLMKRERGADVPALTDPSNVADWCTAWKRELIDQRTITP